MNKQNLFWLIFSITALGTFIIAPPLKDSIYYVVLIFGIMQMIFNMFRQDEINEADRKHRSLLYTLCWDKQPFYEYAMELGVDLEELKENGDIEKIEYYWGLYLLYLNNTHDAPFYPETFVHTTRR